MSDFEGGFGCGYVKAFPCDPRYVHMATLGMVKRTVPYPEKGPNFKVKYCPRFSSFSENEPESSLIYSLSDYERVRARRPDVYASIDKCDVPPKFPDNKFLDHALLLVEQALAPFLESQIGFTDDSTFNLSTSAGFVYLQKQYASKGDAIDSEMFEDLFSRDDFIPLGSIADKDEFLHIDDLKRNKIRTIFVDPLDKLAKTKQIFDQQNKKIIKNCRDLWIKYGMSKQFGGYHKLLIQLERFEITDQSDVSGWDRKIFLFFCYYIRWKLLRYNRKFSRRVFYVMFHSVFPTAITPDGRVIFRQTGCESGGNNTASDNSIAHFIIIVYMLCKKYFEYNNFLPSWDFLVFHALYFIYSDDNLGGINISQFGWCSIDDYIAFKIEVYAEFGLEIKPSSQFCSLTFGRINPKHEFLGSFAYFDTEFQKYIPFPRIGKICSSITRKGLNTGLDESEFFEKVLALTFLSYPHKSVFPVLLKYLHHLFETATYKGAYRQVLYCNNLSFLYSSFLFMHLGWESSKDLLPGLKNVSNFNFFFETMAEADLKVPMSKIAAGRQMMNELIREKLLDPQDVGYVALSCDPFHDEPIECNGMPDGTMGDQITVQAPYQLNFSAPAGTTTPWSFQVVQYPWTTDVTGSAAIAGTFDLVGNWMKQKAVSTNLTTTMPSISIYRGKDGVPLGPFQVDATGNPPIGLGLQSVHTTGNGRLLGLGWEIIDTSAVVNKQGTCTIYRQMLNRKPETYSWLSPAAGPFTGYGNFDGVKFFRPPETVNEANQLLGTITSRGEDGCYVISQQSTDQNDCDQPTMEQPIILTDDFSSGLVSTTPQTVLSSGFQQIAAGTNQVNIPLIRWNWVPFNMSGAFFTGLNPSSTYTLRARYIYERQPSIDESVISLYTKRASGYNPLAIEIRTRCQQKLPVGFPASSNGLGDYFYEFITGVIPDLLGSVNPFLGGLGKLGQGLLGVRRNVQAKRRRPVASVPQPVITPPPPPPRVGRLARPRQNLPQVNRVLVSDRSNFSSSIKKAAKARNKRVRRARNDGWQEVDERDTNFYKRRRA